MGYLYKGDAILKGNLAVNTPKPLDERSIVQNATELLTIDSNYAYNGMPVVSIDEAAIYILLDKTNISSLDSWKKIGNIVIDGTEIDLSSFVTTAELETKLNELKTEISNDIDSKIETALENFNPGSGDSGGGNIDLSGYVTKDELSNYSTSEEIDNIYAKKTEIPTIPNFKTINGQEITGEGDITIQEAGSDITIDDILTEDSSNPVKSSGIYNGIKTMIDAKFVVLTEAEYKAMASHDANTFYYIKQ